MRAVTFAVMVLVRSYMHFCKRRYLHMDIHTSRSPRTTLAAAVEGFVRVTHLDSELCESWMRW